MRAGSVPGSAETSRPNASSAPGAAEKAKGRCYPLAQMIRIDKTRVSPSIVPSGHQADHERQSLALWLARWIVQLESRDESPKLSPAAIHQLLDPLFRGFIINAVEVDSAHRVAVFL
jgi:hypothetical protein